MPMENDPNTAEPSVAFHSTNGFCVFSEVADAL